MVQSEARKVLTTKLLPIVSKTVLKLQATYRVSHSEVYKVNQLGGVGGSIILLNYGA